MKEISKMQYELNKFILKEKLNLDYEDIINGDDKIKSEWFGNFHRAFLAEVFELEEDYIVNFGYESKNALIEIVDMLHFLFSMGHLIKMDIYRDEIIEKIMKSNVLEFEENIGEIHYLSGDLYSKYTWKWWSNDIQFNWIEMKDTIDALFKTIIRLSYWYGFTWKQIKDTYIAKNKVNYERVINGYNSFNKTEDDNLKIIQEMK